MEIRDINKTIEVATLKKRKRRCKIMGLVWFGTSAITAGVLAPILLAQPNHNTSNNNTNIGTGTPGTGTPGDAAKQYDGWVTHNTIYKTEALALEAAKDNLVAERNKVGQKPEQKAGLLYRIVSDSEHHSQTYFAEANSVFQSGGAEAGNIVTDTTSPSIKDIMTNAFYKSWHYQVPGWADPTPVEHPSMTKIKDVNQEIETKLDLNINSYDVNSKPHPITSDMVSNPFKNTYFTVRPDDDHPVWAKSIKHFKLGKYVSENDILTNTLTASGDRKFSMFWSGNRTVDGEWSALSKDLFEKSNNPDVNFAIRFAWTNEDGTHTPLGKTIFIKSDLTDDEVKGYVGGYAWKEGSTTYPALDSNNHQIKIVSGEAGILQYGAIVPGAPLSPDGTPNGAEYQVSSNYYGPKGSDTAKLEKLFTVIKPNKPDGSPATLDDIALSDMQVIKSLPYHAARAWTKADILNSEAKAKVTKVTLNHDFENATSYNP